MIRSFAALQAIDPGFEPRGVMSMVVSVTGSREADPKQRSAFYQQAIARIRAMPGVQSASAINHLPIAGDVWGWPFAVEGRPTPRPGEEPVATYRVVMPDYFRTMHLPILRGRDIDSRDVLGAPRVVIVNEWLARRYWPGEDPIGKRISFESTPTDSTWTTVIGVTKNAVRSDWRAEPEEEIYLPYLQTRSYLEGRSSAVTYLTVVARADCAKQDTCEAAALALGMRAAIAELDRNVTISEAQTVEEVVHEATAEPRFYMLVLGSFAIVALTLAALGIYGVMSHAVSRRTHEIGVRMALGARPGDVLTLVVGQSMRAALWGAAVGLLAAFAVTRLMSTLLYGVGSSDPMTFVAALLVLSGVALLASYIPARRAAHVDPLSALRAE
jgi:putative ABC transport system permease protein